jgi:hypothetical protein
VLLAGLPTNTEETEIKTDILMHDFSVSSVEFFSANSRRNVLTRVSSPSSLPGNSPARMLRLPQGDS